MKSKSLKNLTRRALAGFTLLEILVVISIIGILASVVLVSLSSARDRGRVASALVFDSTNYHSFGSDGIIRLDLADSTYPPIGQSQYNTTYNVGDCFGTGCSLQYSKDTPSGSGNSLNFLPGPTNGMAINFSPAVKLNEYTISIWVKPEAGSNESQDFLIVGYCLNLPSSCPPNTFLKLFKIYLYDGDDEAFRTIVIGNETAPIFVPANIPRNKWSLISYSYSGTETGSGLYNGVAGPNGTNVYSLYVDGKKIYSGYGSDSIPYNGYLDTLVLGSNGQPNNPLVKIGGISVFTHALDK